MNEKSSMLLSQLTNRAVVIVSMSILRNETDHLADIKSFLNVPEQAPPVCLSEQILRTVHQDLNPMPTIVFLKTVLVHAFSGAFSVVFVCPQFGVSPLGNAGIAHLLMHFGYGFCAAACGAIFLGLSFFLSAILLSMPELRVLRRKKVAFSAMVSGLSLIVFYLIKPTSLDPSAIIWVAGAIMGSYGCFEVGFATRFALRSP